VHAWVAEALGELLSLDSKLAVTVKALLSRPGQLTIEWLQGRRVRFLRPLRLYLFTAFLFFLVWSLIGPQRGFVGGLLHGTEASVQRIASLLPTLLIIVLVPYFALLLRVLFRKSSPFFSQHLVLALHFHAFLFLCLLLPAPLSAPTRGFVQLAACLASLAYLALAARRVYGCPTGTAILRCTALLVVYAVSFSVLVVVSAGILVRFGTR
jgi:hypothetical protein